MALDNFRTIELIWDKANKSIIKTIKTASSDTTGRYFSVKVLDEGQEVDLTGAKLQLYWEHPNFNTNGTDDFTTVDTKGKFTLTFSEEMLTNIGELNAYLVLTLSDGKITSDGFPIEVFKGADDGVVVPTNGAGLVKQIDGKIDKGNVTLTDLTQEVKLAMTGGTVAVVGENAVGTENIKDSAVSVDKTNFANSKNKFSGIYTNGVRLGGSLSNGFTLIESSGSRAVIFKGEKGKTYTITKSDDTNSYGVAANAGEPKVGNQMTRALNSNSTFWNFFTVELRGEEDYIVIVVSDENESETPSWLQIEEGSLPTSYSPPTRVAIDLEDGSVPSRAIDLSGVKFTPENTTFAVSGKNKWDGTYAKDLRLGGAIPTFQFMESTNALSVIFKGEKGKTYTISKSNDTDRHGVAVNIGEPFIGKTASRAINSNTNPWDKITVTLQGEEDHIVVHVSSAEQGIEPEWLQIEEGDIATSYSSPNSVRINLEGNEKDNTKVSLINVNKESDKLSIYIPSQTNKSRYIKFDYERVVNPAKNTDSWLQTHSGIYTKTGDIYALDFSLTSGVSDQEGVLSVTGEADFVGGNFHGHEQVIDLDVIVDGNEVDMSKDFNVECSHVKIVQISEVYHHGTTTKAFQKYKISDWDLENYTIEGKWVAEDETSIAQSKVGIFSVDKKHGNKSIVKWGRKNDDYIKTNVSTEFSSTPLHTFKSSEATLQELWSEEENFYVGLNTEYDREKYIGRHYIQDFGDRAKIYFDLGSFTMETGDTVKYINRFDFRY